MPRYIAFLRAINVGGHTVKMDRLRDLFEEMGFGNVETFIASGNVIFESKSRSPQALERKIESALESGLGYRVATFLRTPAELTRIAGHKAFKPVDLNADGNVLYVGFTAKVPTSASRNRVEALATKVDSFHFHGSELYWLRRTEVGESKYSGVLIEKALGCELTMRGMNTVKRLLNKLQ